MIIAGPCAVESHEQMDAIAANVAASGANVLRGGAFKPRTSPYSFQGLEEKGLQFLADAAQKHGLRSISEVMDGESIDLVASYVDILQVGSRNMQNFSLLKRLGKQSKPVFLKRGHSATYREFVGAAEYVLAGGQAEVILCERGIRTFETYTRNTADLAAVPALKELCDLPVVVDPSHGTGRRSLVAPLARAAIAVGADGLMIEVHPNPAEAVSDGQQTLNPLEFEALMRSLEPIAEAVNAKNVLI
jgi:3-deoxy-7-phosphoheptulonate synthase